MAKSQMKGNKEAKEPKGDKPKGGGSAYKLSQSAPSGPATNPLARRNSHPCLRRHHADPAVATATLA
jgi:hypothetical protein